ncbi:hypothetical protein SPF06_18255 [Sinomonas sp. JGH33]|uniref:Glycosyltransferase n=1 Tax=Sinomonas terricola TaxID=3110330 RepID=A0ABU5TAK5_9MICC|nr:hypothetical protein [Sinomonas sp. JGH33]MEA5456670.1 hypothetical protein [Sinomonas sp. JGH33]
MALPLQDEVSAPVARANAWWKIRYLELGLAACGLATAVLILLDIGGVPFAQFKLVVCLAVPGWAAMSRLRPSFDPAARVVWTVAVSTVVYTVVAVTMVWTRFWQPRPAAAVLVLAASAVIVIFPADANSGSRHRAVAERENGARPRPNGLLPWLTLGVAAVMWGVGLASTGRGRLDDFGLLTKFPVMWYVAVGLVVGLCVWGVAAPKMFSALFMSVSLTSLVVMLYASATLLAAVPRYPWTYKHIAVTNFITANGSVDPSIDIYNRWPGFFSLSAFLGEVMGYRNALDYAAWAETAFALVDAVLVLAIARTISNRARVYWTAAIVFTVSDWVNQNYYAPQALSYSLYLSMCLLALTFLRGVPVKWMVSFEGRLRSLRIVKRLKNRPLATLVQKWEQAPSALQGAAVAGLILFQAVIVVSHQLTPYIAVFALSPLFMLGYLKPKWLGPVLLLEAIAYLIPNVDFIRGKYGLFSGFNIFANTGYKPPDTNTIAQGAWVFSGTTLARGAVVLTLLTGVLALAGFVRRLLGGEVRTTVAVAWLAFAPALALLAQSYGGEARFRVYLFALPWLAIGVGWLFWSGPVRSRRMVLGASATLVVMAMLFTVVNFQPEAQNRVSQDDVAASQWLDAHVGPNDTVFDTKHFFPLLIGPNYPHYVRWGGVTSLLDYLTASNGDITVAGLQKYANHLRGAKNNYIIISDDLERWAVESNITEARLLPKLEKVLASGSDAQEVFSNGSVRIYKVAGSGAKSS